MAICGDSWEELQEMIIEIVHLTFEDLGYTYAIDEISNWSMIWKVSLTFTRLSTQRHFLNVLA